RGRRRHVCTQWDEMRRRAIGSLIVPLALLVCASTAFAEDVAPRENPADDVLTTLKRTLAWYQQARITMQSANDAAAGLIVREDEQTVLRIVQRAFDVARAQAALIARSGTAAPAASTPANQRAERRAQLEAAVRDD